MRPLTRTGSGETSTRDLARLLEDFVCRGIHLWAENGRLRFRAAGGSLTLEDRGLLQQHEREILSLLRAERGCDVPDVPGSEAVWLASDAQAGFVRDPNPANMQTTLVFAAGFDLGAFCAALDGLFERHSVLRTRYLDGVDGRLWAVTQSSVTLCVRVLDFTALASLSREQAVVTARSALVDRQFDPGEAPLLRIGVFLIDEQRTQVTFAVHHSIFDGESRAVLYSELRSLYGTARQPTVLPPLPMQFKDAAREQREWLEGPRTHPHLEYWRRHLRGVPGIGWLPADRRTPVADTANLPHVHGEVSEAILDKLNALARERRSTLFAIAYAAFAIVLSRWSALTDICTWVCHHGRRRTEYLPLIGCFLTYWLMRTDLSADPSFLEVIRRVHQEYVQSLPHLGLPVRKLAPLLKQIRRVDPHPGVVFTYHGNTGRDAHEGSMRLGVSHKDSPAGFGRIVPASPLGLKIDVREVDDALVWSFDHMSHRFEEDTIERASRAFGQVLSAAASDPEQPISALLRHRINMVPAEPAALPREGESV